jgi:hypothetical protein
LLHTTENFSYYEAMLVEIISQFKVKKDGKEVTTTSLPTSVEDAMKDRVLHAFFIDVACKFQAYWKRYTMYKHIRALLFRLTARKCY